MTSTAKAATKRPILTLLFHEQQTGNVQPGPSIVRMPGRCSSRLAANFNKTSPTGNLNPPGTDPRPSGRSKIRNRDAQLLAKTARAGTSMWLPLVHRPPSRTTS